MACFLNVQTHPFALLVFLHYPSPTKSEKVLAGGPIVWRHDIPHPTWLEGNFEDRPVDQEVVRLQESPLSDLGGQRAIERPVFTWNSQLEWSNVW